MKINSKFKIQNSKFSSRFSVVGHWKNLFVFMVLLLTAYCSLLTVNAQKRDNLTDAEDLLIRDAQEIDTRMEILVKVIDRRFLALSDPNAAQSKQAQKNLNKWGELRTGSRAELFADIEKTLDEAIGKIDGVSEKDQKSSLFRKAVRILADGCKQFLPQLKPFAEKATDEKEKSPIYNSIEYCNQIIEASGKVPQNEEKKKKN